MRGLFEGVYKKWRMAMVTKNYAGWQETTSRRRQVETRNRILSEKQPFPGAVFRLPTAPPALGGLELVRLKVQGMTAKAVYFGKVDFGVGGEPTDNLLVLSYVQENGWKYDGAEFINLAALPEVKASLAKGDMSVLEKAEFTPTGAMPAIPAVQLKAPVKYIAKVYAYCPNREVTVQVNRTSRHTFANTKQAEVVIGGARDGENLVEFKTKSLPGGNGKEPLAIRVYLMSQRPGVKIPAVFNYEVAEGGAVQGKGQGSFVVDANLVRQLTGL
ncbi:MAG: hypothetical protein AAGC74_10535 [Verrucomicrobiota bacterium]